MRMILLLMVVLGCALVAQEDQEVHGLSFRADSQQRVGDVVKARGNVRIRQGAAVITAHEADISITGVGELDLDLRGNVHVHVKVPPRR